MAADQGGNLKPSSPLLIQPSSTKPGHPVLHTTLYAIREFLGLMFWAYVITKLFVFDIDRYILETYAPPYVWILNYRAIFFLAVAGATFLFCRRLGTVGSLFYIVFYPVALIFWRLPVTLWKQNNWSLTFHILNGTFAFLKRIRYNVPLVSFYAIALALVIAVDVRQIVLVSVATLFIFLIMIYGHRMYIIFKPDNLFEFYKKLLLKLHDHHAASFRLDEDIRCLPFRQLESGQLQRWRSNLEAACVINRVYMVAAKKLRDYQQSGLPILSGIFISMGMLLLTAITFAGIDFGIYKLWPETFTTASAPNFFSFFYYAFNGMFFSGVKEIAPTAPISQASLMMQYFCSLFLVAIFISLLIVIRQQRHSQELNEVINTVEREGAFIEDIIRSEYNFSTIDDAIAELEKLESSILRILLFISRPLR